MKKTFFTQNSSVFTSLPVWISERRSIGASITKGQSLLTRQRNAVHSKEEVADIWEQMLLSPISALSPASHKNLL